MNSVFFNHFSVEAQRQHAQIINAHLGETFPALAIAVIHKGERLVNASWGYVDPDIKNIPVTPDTLFDLASVSKLFTTTAFLSALSASDLTLNTPLVEIIPEFGESGPRPLHGGQDPHSKEMLPLDKDHQTQTVDPSQVTLWHLLTHTSGLAPWRQVYLEAGPVPVPPDQPEPVPHVARWAKGLQAICAYPFVGQPDTGVRYSDLGLMLLGEVVVRLHGQSADLAEAVHELVTKPMDLRTVMYNPVRLGHPQENVVPTEDDPEWRGRRPCGEVHDENACGLGGIAGHAGLFATAADVVAFGQAWLEDPTRAFAIDDALASAAIHEQVDDAGTRRGLGWSIKARQNSAAGDHMSENAFGHLGFTGTSLWVDPQRELVVACLTNRVYPGRHQQGIHAFRRDIHDAIVQSVDAIN